MTLTELAIVMAVLVVLGAIGYASLRDQLPRFRTVKAARRLRSDLLDLRELAVRSNRETRLVLTGSGGDCRDGRSWGGSWLLQIGNSSLGSNRWDTLPEDSLEDGSDDDGTEGVVDIGPGGNHPMADACLRQWGSIAGPGSGDNADSIVFSPRGWVRNPASDFGSNGYLTLTIVNTDSVARGSADEISVLVTRAGMIRLADNRGDSDVGTAGTAISSTAE